MPKGKKMGQRYKALTKARKDNNATRRKIKIRKQMQKNTSRVYSA